jgi:carboxylesterase type B
MKSYAFQPVVTALLCLLSGPLVDAHKQPVVQVKNGTLVGDYVASYQQDLFLGVPYAQAPIGNLRFENPKPYNKKYKSRDATRYSDSCVGYGVSKILSLERDFRDNCMVLTCSTIEQPSMASYHERRLPDS